MRNIKMLLFDLDGTLVDSRRDIANSINIMLQEMGAQSLSIEEVERLIGDGANVLVRQCLNIGFNQEVSDSKLVEGIKIFRNAYEEHLLDHTTIYPNVLEVLEAFADFPRAIVTNKPYTFTEKLLEGLGIRKHFAVVIGGDSFPERKPSPVPILAALSQCKISPQNALMIGDSINDILAGRQAGTFTCGVSYGFESKEKLEAAKADLIVDDLGAIGSFLISKEV